MNIFEFFQDRRNQMDRGFLGYNRKVMADFNSQPDRRMLAKAIISAQGRAEKSDPFLTRRLMSRINNGTSTVEDYHVEFVPAYMTTVLSPEKAVEIIVPRNRKMA